MKNIISEKYALNCHLEKFLYKFDEIEFIAFESHFKA